MRDNGRVPIEPPNEDELQEARVRNRAGRTIARIVGALDWDKDLHPRWEAGTERGGEFIKRSRRGDSRGRAPELRYDFKKKPVQKIRFGHRAPAPDGKGQAGSIAKGFDPPPPPALSPKPRRPATHAEARKFAALPVGMASPEQSREKLAELAALPGAMESPPLGEAKATKADADLKWQGDWTMMENENGRTRFDAVMLRRGGKVVAAVQLALREWYPRKEPEGWALDREAGYFVPEVALIKLIVVDPDHRRQGLATELMDRIKVDYADYKVASTDQTPMGRAFYDATGQMTGVYGSEAGSEPNLKAEDVTGALDEMGEMAAGMDSPEFYHVAPSSEQENIAKNGLAPGEPRANKYHEVPHPAGVYVWTDFRTAEGYALDLTAALDSPQDIWKVTSPVSEPDPIHGENGKARYIPSDQPVRAEQVKRITKADVEAVVQGRGQASPEVFFESDWEAPLFIGGLDDRVERKVGVGERRNGHFVGAVTATIQRAGDGTPKSLGIDMIVVHPDWQRQGIGADLVRKLQAEYPEYATMTNRRTADGKGLFTGFPDIEQWEGPGAAEPIPDGDITDSLTGLDQRFGMDSPSGEAFGLVRKGMDSPAVEAEPWADPTTVYDDRKVAAAAAEWADSLTPDQRTAMEVWTETASAPMGDWQTVDDAARTGRLRQETALYRTVDASYSRGLDTLEQGDTWVNNGRLMSTSTDLNVTWEFGDIGVLDEDMLLLTFDAHPGQRVGFPSITSEMFVDQREVLIPTGQRMRVVRREVKPRGYRPLGSPEPSRDGKVISLHMELLGDAGTMDSPEMGGGAAMAMLTSMDERFGPGPTDGMDSPAGGWTATEADDHPRLPKTAAWGARGGEYVRVGTRVRTSDGRDWEVTQISLGHVVLDETSSDLDKVEMRILKPGDPEIKKLKPAKRVKLTQKHEEGGNMSGTIKVGKNVRVVSPYVEPSTHRADLKLPATSKLTATQWEKFGEVEQLHYLDLMARYGEWTSAVNPKAMAQSMMADFDTDIASLVKNAHHGQQGKATGGTMSLISLTGTDVDMTRRDKAMELHGRMRDVIAWDWYNRLRAPDVTLIHGSSKHSEAWWKQRLKDGKGKVYSGISQTWSALSSDSFGNTKIITPTSIRLVVMASSVASLTGGSMSSEREVAIVPQIKGDLTRSVVLDKANFTASARKWFWGETSRPRDGGLATMLRDYLDQGGDLPVIVDHELHIPPADQLPPPPLAEAAMDEYAADLPAILGEAHDPATLDKDIPWRSMDENGNPVAEQAKEAGIKAGDFMIGMKGTLYWIGPDPGAEGGFGLRYHKMIVDSDGKLKFDGNSWDFENGGIRTYYFLKGNVPPLAPADAPHYDAGEWQAAAEKPMKLLDMAVGDTFKIDGTHFELLDPGTATAKAKIRDMVTGHQGTANAEYKVVRMISSGYTGTAKMKPEKGMTLAYGGKKHIVTSVKKDGTVSVKPASGGAVFPLAPDDGALEHLFHGADWQIGEKTTMGGLTKGDYFQGGRGVKLLKPYLVTKVEGSWVYWQNMDTGKTGKSLKKKGVRRMVALKGSASDTTQATTQAVPTPDPNVTLAPSVDPNTNLIHVNNAAHEVAGGYVPEGTVYGDDMGGISGAEIGKGDIGTMGKSGEMYLVIGKTGGVLELQQISPDPHAEPTSMSEDLLHFDGHFKQDAAATAEATGKTGSLSDWSVHIDGHFKQDAAATAEATGKTGSPKWVSVHIGASEFKVRRGAGDVVDGTHYDPDSGSVETGKAAVGDIVGLTFPGSGGWKRWLVVGKNADGDVELVPVSPSGVKPADDQKKITTSAIGIFSAHWKPKTVAPGPTDALPEADATGPPVEPVTQHAAKTWKDLLDEWQAGSVWDGNINVGGVPATLVDVMVAGGGGVGGGGMIVVKSKRTDNGAMDFMAFSANDPMPPSDLKSGTDPGLIAQYNLQDDNQPMDEITALEVEPGDIVYEMGGDRYWYVGATQWESGGTATGMYGRKMLPSENGLTLGPWSKIPTDGSSAAGVTDPNEIVQVYRPDSFTAPVPATDIDALPEANLEGYLSAWGSGAKYKHDRIRDMPVGTVFQDKNKKLWKVQGNDALAIITDGTSNFTVDGDIRGRALPDHQLDGPPPPITENPYETGAPKLPTFDISFTEAVGTTVANYGGGFVKLPDGPEAMDGESYLLKKGKWGVNTLYPLEGGEPMQVSGDLAVSQYSPYSTAGHGPKPELILPDMGANEDTLLELMDKGGKFHYTHKGALWSYDPDAEPPAKVVLPDGSHVVASVMGIGSFMTIVPDKVLWADNGPVISTPSPLPMGDLSAVKVPVHDDAVTVGSLPEGAIIRLKGQKTVLITNPDAEGGFWPEGVMLSNGTKAVTMSGLKVAAYDLPDPAAGKITNPPGPGNFAPSALTMQEGIDLAREGGNDVFFIKDGHTYVYRSGSGNVLEILLPNGQTEPVSAFKWEGYRPDVTQKPDAAYFELGVVEWNPLVEPSLPEPTDVDEPVALKNMTPFDEFEYGGKGYELIAIGQHGIYLRRMKDGGTASFKTDATTSDIADANFFVQPTPTPAPEPEVLTPAPPVAGGGSAFYTFQKMAENMGVSGQDALPEPAIQGFQSEWGSGGKYKHEMIGTLGAGEHFQVKGVKGENGEYVVLKSISGGYVVVWHPVSGTLWKMDGTLRVKVAPA